MQVNAATRRWVPPRACFHKLNVDAAIDKNGHKGSISVVCRNEEGLYVGSSALVYQGLTDPMILEALVCRKALALAKDLMLQQLTVVSDCKPVVMDMHTGTMGAIASIVHELLDTSEDFLTCNFVFESRLSNMEAHRLARHALHLEEGRHVWLMNPHDPSIIPVLRTLDQ